MLTEERAGRACAFVALCDALKYSTAAFNSWDDLCRMYSSFGDQFKIKRDKVPP